MAATAAPPHLNFCSPSTARAHHSPRLWTCNTRATFKSIKRWLSCLKSRTQQLILCLSPRKRKEWCFQAALRHTSTHRNSWWTQRWQSVKELQRNLQPFDAGAELRQQQSCEHTQRPGERAAPHRAPSSSHKHKGLSSSQVKGHGTAISPAENHRNYMKGSMQTQKNTCKQRDKFPVVEQNVK